MCGLLGVYTTQFGKTEFGIFEKLLFLNFFRGGDSTGVIRVGKDFKAKTRKSILSSPEFLAIEASDFIRDKNTNDRPVALIGHTRAATKGAVTLKNAHPFGFSDVVGMHNGTIHTTFKHRKDFETDSEALYKNINDDGLEKALTEVAAYDTAYALQFVNKKEKTLNFVKNSKRTLWFTYLYSETTLIWSSEKLALEYVLKSMSLSNNKGWRGDDKERFFTLRPNDLLQIKLGESPAKATLTELKVEEKKTTTSATTSGTRTVSTYRDTMETTEWVQTPTGYKLVKKEPNRSILPVTHAPAMIGPGSPRLIVDNSEKKTTTSSGTSGQTSVPVTRTSTNTSTTKGGTGTKECTEVSGQDNSPYENFRDEADVKALRRLSWLQPPKSVKKGEDVQAKPFLPEEEWTDPNFDPDEQPWEEIGAHVEHTYRGYQGAHISEREFRYRLKDGCFACGTSLDLGDAHDFEQINSIVWWSRDNWACHECYNDSDSDWVRHVIDDSWNEADEKKG